MSLAQLNESTHRNRIYLVLLDQRLSLIADASGSSWSSTQIGIWASKGQLIALQNPEFIPGTEATSVEVIPFHQAYLVKPDLSKLILHQRKSKSGFLINTLEKRSFSCLVKRKGDSFELSESASLDQIAARLMEGRMQLQQFITLQAGKWVDVDREPISEHCLIELIMIPRGVLFRPLKQQPVLGK